PGHAHPVDSGSICLVCAIGEIMPGARPPWREKVARQVSGVSRRSWVEGPRDAPFANGRTGMHVEMRPLASITPYDNNPRRNDGAIEAVAASVREYGWRVPVVVDEQGVILAGHTRFKAAQKLGLSEVPV